MTRGGMAAASVMALALGVLGYLLGLEHGSRPTADVVEALGAAPGAGGLPSSVPALPVTPMSAGSTHPGDGRQPTVSTTPRAARVPTTQWRAALLRGRVLYADGRPALQCVVEVQRLSTAEAAAPRADWRADPYWWHPAKPGAVTVSTAPDGGFELVRLWRGPVRLCARASGVPPRRAVAYVTMVEGEIGWCEMRLSTLDRGPRLVGTVRDQFGNRVPQARVTANWQANPGKPRETVTGPLGTFVLPQLPRLEAGRAEVSFSVTAKGYGTFVSSLYPAGPADLRVDAVLSVATTLRVRLRTSDGTPLPAKRIVVTRFRPEHFVPEIDLDTSWLEVDEAGMAEEEFEEPGVVEVIAVTRTHRSAVTRVRISRLGSEQVVELILSPIPSHRVTVTAADGSAFTGGVHAELEFLDGSPPSPWWEPLFGLETDRLVVVGQVVHVPRGLQGPWVLRIGAVDEGWEILEIRLGNVPPTQVSLRRMVAVLQATLVQPTTATDAGIVVDGRWTGGGRSGSFAIDTDREGATSKATVRVTRPAVTHPVEVLLTLRIPGWKPLTIGPTTLQPGERLPLTELRFERD